MRISLLGPTQVHGADGSAVPVGGARLRALLTVLALRAGRTVPVGLLIDEVWDGDPPADAPGALQALVGRLRRALGPDAVVSAAGGYRLGADADDVDLHRFERLTAEGVRALEAGDPYKAVTALDDALALWRGGALADLPDRTAEAARWETRRHEARRARLTALLALGRGQETLPELAALCGEFPLDEPLQALRIRALRAAGRAAEALAAYEAVRQDLAIRLGTTPGPELRTLHTELLTPASARRGGARDVRRPAGDGAPVPGGHLATGPARPAAPGPGGPPVGGSHGHPDAGPRRGGDAPGTSGRRGEASDGRFSAGDGRGGAAAGPGPGVPPVGGSHGHLDTGPRRGGDAHRPAGPGAGVAPAGAFGRRGEAPDGRRPAGGSGGRPETAPRRGNVRARLTSFVGREEDIGVVLGDLARARLVTLLGPGGAGKTRLSQEAAERGAQAWPDGVWLAELAPVDDPDAVPDAVLTALGARQTVLRGAGAEELRAAERHGDADDALVRLAEHCSGRRMLILLDNCEHVVTAAATLAERLLEECPGLTVLATSREPLGVPGETVRPVDPLPDPMALRLLAERGAAARPGFDVADDPDACAEICRRLDGLPLAIELAAARLRMLTPRQIADRLDDRFRLLTGGSRTVLPRQQTLRAVVDWSWDLLDEPERAVLRRLSVFSGGCDLDAAEAVCGGHTLDLLGSLVDKSLVVATPTEGGDMRYRLLETVSEYTAERLDQAGDRAAAEHRHLVHYRELARTADPELRGPRQRAALDCLQLEYENLRTALRRAVAASDEHEALCLVLSLVWYWHMRDLRTDALHWSEAAAALGPDPYAPPVTPAPPLTERCTDAPPPMDDDQLQEARRGVRLVQLLNMDHQTSTWTTPDGLERLRRMRGAYRPGLPQTCRMPGTLWWYAVLLTGDPGELRGLLDETVDTCRRYQYEWELAGVLQMRANVLANRSDWAGDAARDADESLKIFDRLGDSWGAAEALAARAEARERRGEFEGAAEDFEAAIGHAARLGAQAQMSLLRVRYAETLNETGRGAEGEAILREVLARGRSAGHEAVPAARLYLALWLGRTGRTAEAREQLRVVREEFAYDSLSLFEGFTLGVLAWLDNLDGRYTDALDRAARALAHAREPLSMMVAPHMPAIHLVTAARALTGLGGRDRARTGAVLLGTHAGLLPDGHVLTPMERENLADAKGAARAALGDAAFDAAYAEGGGLTAEEAAALLHST
ncbi:BTAD domain-containing putative transcriptional regulator [Streptomyces sp. CB03238]|uniref:AfsR/SARP family transcriptional regulator n=1 Tax=Streptomyces sp. CB03238 TaxID=1907777 RepID=UPI001F4E22F2|nr:BTAD domain-containing putative transcriptional regulator [Streptomyces sp. CB03238]